MAARQAQIFTVLSKKLDMNHKDFKQAKGWIIKDIRREILLAYAGKNSEHKTALAKIGIPDGGGNFLAAVGLLSYTEFAGRVKFNVRNRRGEPIASANFNRFFDSLGPDYSAFRATGVNVYDVFRCGLVHEYFTKKNCTIYMTKKRKKPIGIGRDGRGHLFFVVETYFEHLKAALDTLEHDLYGVIT